MDKIEDRMKDTMSKIDKLSSNKNIQEPQNKSSFNVKGGTITPINE